MTAQCQPLLGSIADVAEELMSEFGKQVPLAIVTAIVLAAHRDLTGQVPENALTEMLYRLARQRLVA